MNQPPLASVLAADEYTRQRLAPAVRDALYLHLSDLKLALQAFAIEDRIRVLDVGCGGSPYRSFFPNATYHRADFVSDAITPVDYLLDERSSIPAAPMQFDLVLSTQVAEHVSDPHHYFEEMFRVLRPGGFLILTTHGFFEEHGCPHDFQRWTAPGLRRDLERAGFQVAKMEKLTVGARAWCFTVLWHMNKLKGSSYWFPAIAAPSCVVWQVGSGLGYIASQTFGTKNFE